MVRRASSESDSLLLSSSSNTNGSVSSSPAKSKSGNMAERRCASSGAPDTMMSASRNKLEETRRRGPFLRGRVSAKMAASRVAGRYLVLDHLDVRQPYPFIRLWERWGLGEGPPREETRRHRRRPEPPWSQPRPSPPPDHRHRRPRREDPPAPTFREAPRESDPIWDDEVSADGREDERPPSDFETHDDEDEGTAEEEPKEDPGVPPPPPPAPPASEPAMVTVDEMRAMGAKAPLVPTKRVVSDEEARALAERKEAAAAAVRRRLEELTIRQAETDAAAAAEKKEDPVEPPEPTPEPTPTPAPEKQPKEEPKEEPKEAFAELQRYAPDELRAMNVNCESPPPGFKADPGWAVSSRAPKPKRRDAAAAAEEERKDREDDAAADALRIEIAKVDAAGWSLWEDDEAAFAEDQALALSALKEIDDGKASLIAEADARADARATPRVDLVVFPPGALSAFSKNDVDTSGCTRPYADVKSSLGVVFGTWSEVDGGAGGWRARVGFVQPWEGEPDALVAWLNADEAAGDAAGASMIKPVGWLKTMHMTGPALTASITSAYELLADRSRFVGAPPPASAMYVSLDVVRTVTEERACVEVYDLRTGRELVFELSGEDDDDE